QRYPVLLASQWGIVPAELYGYGLLASNGFVIGCVIYSLIILMFVATACIHHPYLRMWLLGMLFSLVPATTALPQDRVLTFAGIGASAVLAHFIFVVFRQKTPIGPFPRWSAVT